MRASLLRSAVALAAALAVLTGCTDNGSPGPTSPTVSNAGDGSTDPAGVEQAEQLPFGPGEFGDEQLQADIEQLAAWGIETYETAGDDAPMVEATDPVPYSLLLSQVTYLGSSAASGSGIAAADLDGLFAGVIGRDIHLSRLLAFYLQSDSTAAKDLLPALAYTDVEHPDKAVFPEIVLVAFVRDVLEMTAASDGEASQAAHKFQQDETPAMQVEYAAAKQAFNPCALAGNFVEDFIKKIFAGLKINRIDTTNLKPPWLWLAEGANFVLPVLDALRQGLEFVFVNGTRIALAPIRDIIAKIAGVAGMVTAIGTLIRPLNPTLKLEPGAAEYGIDGATPLAYTEKLSVAAVGPTEWPQQVQDCAAAADITLPDIKLAGSKVQWSVTSGLPGAVIEKSKDEVLIDEAGTAVARYRFETPTEPQEWHDNGPPQGIQVQVRVTIKRKTEELDKQIKAVYKSLFGPLPDFLRDRAAGVLQNATANIIKQITDLSNVKVADTFGILHHGPPETTAPPETSGSGPSTPGPVWVHVERPRLPGALPGRILDLVSCTGPYGTWSGKLRSGGLLAPSDGFRVPWADIPVKTFKVGGSGTRTVSTTADGIVIIPFPVERRVPLHYNLSVTVNGKTMSIAGVPVQARVSFQNIPIQPAPAGRC